MPTEMMMQFNYAADKILSEMKHIPPCQVRQESAPNAGTTTHVDAEAEARKDEA